MTKKHILSLSLKILGIYAMINSIYLIGGVIQSFGFIEEQRTMSQYIFIGSLVTFLLLNLTGSFLIFMSNKIAKDPDTDADRTYSVNSIRFSDLQELSYSIVGIFILITAIPSLFRLCGNIFVSEKHIFLSTIASGIGVGVQIIVGLWLFIGSKGFVKLWQKLRQRWDHERKSDAI
jgi:hypothetical protein